MSSVLVEVRSGRQHDIVPFSRVPCVGESVSVRGSDYTVKYVLHYPFSCSCHRQSDPAALITVE